MADIDRIDEFDSYRTTTDRIGDSITLGNGRVTSTVSMLETAALTMEGTLRPPSAFVINASAIFTGLPQPSFDMDVVASMGFEMEGSWNINTANYSGKSLSFAGHGTTPVGIIFNPSGTTMIVAMLGDNTLYQYTLSTPFDVSTGSYTDKNLSVSAQDASIVGLTVSDDGTSLYVIGDAHRAVYQYTLPTPFDLTSANYSGKSLSVATQITSNADGVFISPDGTKVYAVGGTSRKVFQYTLSTPFDLSTGSYSGKSLEVAYEITIPFGCSMSVDGTKFYVIDRVDFSRDIHQYTLGTPYDLSTGSYSGKYFVVGSEETLPNGLAFMPSGTAMFLVGSSNKVYQYTMA